MAKGLEQQLTTLALVISCKHPDVQSDEATQEAGKLMDSLVTTRRKEVLAVLGKLPEHTQEFLRGWMNLGSEVK